MPAESANHLASSAKKSIFGSLLKEEIEAESFVLPKMINVIDASEKRTVDLEFGAIGWQSKEGKIKVLHIYEDALDIVPCDFYPSASSKSGLVFYVDQLNRIAISSFLNISILSPTKRGRSYWTLPITWVQSTAISSAVKKNAVSYRERPRESKRRNSKSMVYPSRRRIRVKLRRSSKNMALP